MKTKKLIYVAAAVLLCAAPALAILGIDDIVFDPTNFDEAVRELVQLEQQYAQLVEIYNMNARQYSLQQWMATANPVNMFLRYRALVSPWQPFTATNTYGTTAGWILGASTGAGVPAGYAQATEPLQAYGGAFGNIPADQANRIRTDYATLELTDGANISALETIGRIRANASEVETAIANLEADSLSSDPSMNTEIAVLNKISAANVISLRNTQDANKLLTTLAEERILEAKRQRDTEAQAFNQDILFRRQAQAEMAAQAAGASAAMLAWRMP